MLSVGCSVAAAGAAGALGVAQASTVLVALGAVGFIDAVGSAALAYHFHYGLRHDGLADHLERVAHRVVIAGLVGVGVGAVAAGAAHLRDRPRPASAALAAPLAAVSLLVLVCLWRAKRRLAISVGSAALRSDSHLSAIGAAQSAVALGGVLAAVVGWRWADPAAAIAVGAVAVVVGVRTGRGAPRARVDHA
jgi:divalent metal cation (Fe/Co/Zn/Cd) transporter